MLNQSTKKLETKAPISVTIDKLLIKLELFFLKTPNISKNIIDIEINISG